MEFSGPTPETLASYAIVTPEAMGASLSEIGWNTSGIVSHTEHTFFTNVEGRKIYVSGRFRGQAIMTVVGVGDAPTTHGSYNPIGGLPQLESNPNTEDTYAASCSLLTRLGLIQRGTLEYCMQEWTRGSETIVIAFFPGLIPIVHGIKVGGPPPNTAPGTSLSGTRLTQAWFKFGATQMVQHPEEIATKLGDLYSMWLGPDHPCRIEDGSGRFWHRIGFDVGGAGTDGWAVRRRDIAARKQESVLTRQFFKRLADQSEWFGPAMRRSARAHENRRGRIALLSAAVELASGDEDSSGEAPAPPPQKKRK